MGKRMRSNADNVAREIVKLEKGERLEGAWKPALSSFWPCLLASALSPVFAVVLLVAFPSAVTAVAFACLVLLGVALSYIAVLLRRAYTYFITSRRVGFAFKFVVSRTYEIPLHAVTDVTVKQDLIGALYNYGTVIISSAGTTFFGVVFRGVPNPYVVVAKIRQLVGKRR